MFVAGGGTGGVALLLLGKSSLPEKCCAPFRVAPAVLRPRQVPRTFMTDEDKETVSRERKAPPREEEETTKACYDDIPYNVEFKFTSGFATKKISVTNMMSIKEVKALVEATLVRDSPPMGPWPPEKAAGMRLVYGGKVLGSTTQAGEAERLGAYNPSTCLKPLFRPGLAAPGRANQRTRIIYISRSPHRVLPLRVVACPTHCVVTEDPTLKHGKSALHSSNPGSTPTHFGTANRDPRKTAAPALRLPAAGPPPPLALPVRCMPLQQLQRPRRRLAREPAARQQQQPRQHVDEDDEQPPETSRRLRDEFGRSST